MPIVQIQPGQFRYEPDPSLSPKHKWDEDRAGAVAGRGRGAYVCKCPRGLDLTLAQRLLDTGIGHSPSRGWNREHPCEIYNLHDGVPYRGKPTNPGRSYHGFPEIDASKIPGEVRKQLYHLARQRGEELALDRWLKRGSWR